MRWNGKNSENKPIVNIYDLNGPEIDEVYLMSCNTANEMLLKYEGSNVADAFRDLPNVSKVYGYDGSMGYGDEKKLKRAIDYYITKEFNPRLSDEQDVFDTLVSTYRSMIDSSPEKKQLETPDGLFLYED